MRFREGTTIDEANRVETVSVELTTRLLPVMVENAMVETVMDEPASVENSLRFREGTTMVEANRVETVSVELTNTLLLVMVEPNRELILAVVPLMVEPLNVENWMVLEIVVVVEMVEPKRDE